MKVVPSAPNRIVPNLCPGMAAYFAGPVSVVGMREARHVLLSRLLQTPQSLLDACTRTGAGPLAASLTRYALIEFGHSVHSRQCQPVFVDAGPTSKAEGGRPVRWDR